jgi:alpha-ketoglutarate-dependent taurine dioxygenase
VGEVLTIMEGIQERERMRERERQRKRERETNRQTDRQREGEGMEKIQLLRTHPQCSKTYFFHRPCVIKFSDPPHKEPPFWEYTVYPNPNREKCESISFSFLISLF